MGEQGNYVIETTINGNILIRNQYTTPTHIPLYFTIETTKKEDKPLKEFKFFNGHKS